MPEPEPPQQYVSFSRAHLEQRDQFYPEDETEEDGDAWSKVGLTSQTDEHQDDTSTRRKVANSSRPHERWRRHPSHSWPLIEDGANFDYHNGRSQLSRNPFDPRPGRPPEPPHPSNLHPTIPYNPSPRNPYSTQSSPGYYPNDHYPPEQPYVNYFHPQPPPYPPPYPPPLFAPQPPFIPPPRPYVAHEHPHPRAYDPNFRSPPPPPFINSTYHKDRELETVNRTFRRDPDKMEKQMAQMKLQIEKDERRREDAIRRKEARMRTEEEMKQKLKREIMAELGKGNVETKSEPAGKPLESGSRELLEEMKLELKREIIAELDKGNVETQSEPASKPREYVARELLELALPHLVDRQVENCLRTWEGRRGGEADRLLEFFDLYGRKQQLDRARSEMGSVRGSWDKPGRDTLEAFPRQHYPNRGYDALRHQVESIVVDVLSQRGEEVQEADYTPERPIFPSSEFGRFNRPHFFTQAPSFDSGRDWLSRDQQTSRRSGQDNNDSRNAVGPTSPDSSLRLRSSSSHTASNSRDQYSRTQRPPTANTQRYEGGEGTESSRAPHGHLSTFLNPNSNSSAAIRRNKPPTYQDTVNPEDEPEAEGLERERRPYNILKTAPPRVPDPPPSSRRKQPMGSPETQHSRRPTIEDIQDEELGSSSHFSGNY